ncbi:MAG: Asp-tRNA(Asn)/Glu-tRNA(Gln) amidotransferase subunit GatA [Selenomonadaceae bacterium]
MRLFDKPAHVLHDMLVKKEITAVALTQDVLDRIDEVDGEVKAYLTVTREDALVQAAAVDAKISRGESISFWEGIPGAIKDNICTKGVRTTCASKMLENFVPPYNATVMEKIAEVNPVILGKANMDEFAMGGSTENSAYFPTANPWQHDCVPGGSSGGSAAAVAAGTAVWALGSDTGGSIRQPASFCGVVGMKPTYGRVSRYGLVAFASSLDQIGPLTRDVTDCAHLLNVIAGYDEKDSTSTKAEVPDFTKSLVQDVKGLKIGMPKEYFAKGLDPEVEKSVRAAIAQLESLGAEIVEISLPHTAYAISAYYLIAPAEASSNLARYDGVSYGERVDGVDIVDMMTKTRSEKFGEEVKRRIMIGSYALSAGYYDAYYLKALKVRTLVKQDFDQAFEKVDVIMSPAAPTPAYKIGEMASDPLKMYMQDVYTVPLNLAGLPGISVPCGFSSAGLPIGLQIIGKALAEDTLIRAAYTYEQSQQFHNKIAGLGGENA